MGLDNYMFHFVERANMKSDGGSIEKMLVHLAER